MARDVIVKVFIVRIGEQRYFVVYRGDTPANDKCIDDTRLDLDGSVMSCHGSR